MENPTIRTKYAIDIIKWLDHIIQHRKVKGVCVGDIYKAVYQFKNLTQNKIPHKTDYFLNKFKEVNKKSYKCSKRYKINIVIFNIHLNDINLDKLYKHMNIVIIDNLNKVYERFEPNGFFYDDIVDNTLNNEFRETFKLKNYTYIPSNTICPYIGPQRYMIVGPNPIESTCIYWSTWYAEQRIIYPDKSPYTIINEIISKGKIFMKNLIIDYIIHLKENDILISVYDLRYKTISKKVSSKKSSSKKSSSKKSSSKKSSSKKSSSKKSSSKKSSSKKSSSKKSSSKKCKENEEINYKTQRCRKKCKEGEKRNENNGRCIKIKK
jgi:hypothetical protein